MSNQDADSKQLQSRTEQLVVRRVPSPRAGLDNPEMTTLGDER